MFFFLSLCLCDKLVVHIRARRRFLIEQRYWGGYKKRSSHVCVCFCKSNPHGTSDKSTSVIAVLFRGVRIKNKATAVNNSRATRCLLRHSPCTDTQTPGAHSRPQGTWSCEIGVEQTLQPVAASPSARRIM